MKFFSGRCECPAACMLLLLLWACDSQPRYEELRQGMVIDEWVVIRPGQYRMNGSEEPGQPLIEIRGENIVVDFNGAEIIGSTDKETPDDYYGLAIKVGSGRNITVKNLKVSGFKVALLAEGVDSLKLIDCDFSYNYRQRLYSTRERENPADWLSYRGNEHDEWLGYGAAVYLKSCRGALVRGLRVTGGQNGLMLSACENGLFYNNHIHFNSGVGIGLYRSSGNRVMHNRLDWNVRGYSHGFYVGEQGSAGIICYGQSRDNVFAFNSVTHSGGALFHGAGQQGLDGAASGCTGNIIFGNDLSFSASPVPAGNEAVTAPPSGLPPVTARYRGDSLPPLPDGMDAMLPETQPKGRAFILLDEWGPYDFRTPSVWLRDIKGDRFVFLLLGPQGNWKLNGGEGFESVNPKTGTLPATVTARKTPDAEYLRLDFEFIGEAGVTRLGREVGRGTAFPFRFTRFEPPLSWRVRWYEYGEAQSPLEHYAAFRRLREGAPGHEEQTDTLSYLWRGSPGGTIDADRFATFAEATVELPEGAYRLTLSSADGVRLYIGGELLIDHWDIHPPSVDEIEVRLGGEQHIEIEHFEAGGLANLDFRIRPSEEWR